MSEDFDMGDHATDIYDNCGNLYINCTCEEKPSDNMTTDDLDNYGMNLSLVITAIF